MWRLRYNTVAVGGRRGWRGLGFQLRSVVHIWHNGYLTRRRHTHTATTNESDDGVEERWAVFAGNRETGACGECSNAVVWACGAAAPCVVLRRRGRAWAQQGRTRREAPDGQLDSGGACSSSRWGGVVRWQSKTCSLSLLSLIWLRVARLSCLRWHQGRKGARGIHWNRLDVAGDGAVGVERGAKDRCGRRWRGRRRLQGGQSEFVAFFFLLVLKLSMGGRRHPSLPSQLRRARQGAAAHMISTV